MVRTLLTSALLSGTAFFSHAPALAETVYSPARLLEGERSIESLIEVPEALPAGLYIVQCETWISTSGQPRWLGCHSDRKLPEDLVAIVERAGVQAAFAPARRDDKPMQARMQLSVRIYVGRGGPLVLAVPNNGADADKYGLLYTAPQRLTGIRWPVLTRVRDAYLKDNPLLIWLMLDVNEAGKVTQAALRNASQADADLVTAFELQMRQLEFIPGFFEGKPTSMMHVEPLYSDKPR